jgi:hypothetical protein
MEMNKTTTLLIVVVVAGALLATVILLTRPQPEQETFSEDFESGFDAWSADSDVPEDPNNPGNPVAWAIVRVSNNSFSGNYSVLMSIDERQDDGTIWIERKLTLDASSMKSVNVSFQLWSASESFNTLAEVVGYVGKYSPEAEADFQVQGAANQISGWLAYSFSSEISTDDTGEVYVALGISVTWETKMSYFIDAVEITVS